MVLKVANVNRDGSFLGWTFYDGIKTATVYNANEDGKIFQMVDMIDSPHSCVLAVITEAYLMNDNGKTLMVVCPGGDYPTNVMGEKK